MSCATGIDNVKIDPVNITWVGEQKSCVETVADVASSLQNKYFVLYSAKDAILFHVWFNVGAAGVDPAPSGSTGLEVAISANATAAAVATAAQLIITAHAAFTATVSGSDITILNVDVGETTNIADSDSGFTFTTLTEGVDFDLGLLDGDINPSFVENLSAITAHQTGLQNLGDTRQGSLVEDLETVLLEADAKFADVFGPGGAKFIPAGGSSEVVGVGDANIGTNTFVQANRLILKPVNATDNLKNITFWKAYPMPSSILYSGENVKTLTVAWKIYKDDSKDSRASLWVRGDQTQTGL